MKPRKRLPSCVVIWTKDAKGSKRHPRHVTLTLGRSVDEEVEEYVVAHKGCCNVDGLVYEISGDTIFFDKD